MKIMIIITKSTPNGSELEMTSVQKNETTDWEKYKENGFEFKIQCDKS